MARERQPDRKKRLAPYADPTKNLKAARFFLGHLNEEQGRGFAARQEPLEFYLSACINAANGSVEALKEKVGEDTFACLEEEWRKHHPSDDLNLFDRLRDLRIEDFHYGVLHAPVGRKWVNAAGLRGIQVFSPPGVFVEETNPGGEVVRGPALASVQTLNITHAGGQLEASEACQRFIALVESLVAHALPPARGTTP